MCSGTCGRCYQCQDTCNCVPLNYEDAPIDKIDAEGVIYNMDTNCSTSNLMCFFGIRNGTNLKTILEKLDARLCQVRGLFDEKVKVSIDDTSEGYLFDKLIVGNCITKNIVTDTLGKQQLQLAVDCNCIKTCVNNIPTTCFLPVYGNPLRICNGATTSVQVSTTNTGNNIVQFSANEGATWVDGNPNNYSFIFPSNGTLQKIKARLKGCNEYVDGLVQLCTTVTPTAPTAPSPVPTTPVSVPTAPSPVPVTPTPIITPVNTPVSTPVSTPTSTPTSTPITTPVIAPVACVSISNFNYTINGNSNINGFTLSGVQDVNISITSLTPSNATTPIYYEYILDGFSSGIISSNSKSFSSVNVGDHTLSLISYNCTGNITKNINFAINNAPTVTPNAPTVPTVPTTPTAPNAPVAPPAFRQIQLGNPTSSTDTAACGVTSGNSKYIDYTFAITSGLVIWNNPDLSGKTYSSNPGNWSMLYDTTGANGVNGGKRYAVQFDGSGNVSNIVDCATITPVATPTTPTTPTAPTAPTVTPVTPTPVAINGYQYNVTVCSSGGTSTIVASASNLVIGNVYSESTGDGNIRECYTITSSATGVSTSGLTFNLISSCGNTQRCAQL